MAEDKVRAENEIHTVTAEKTVLQLHANSSSHNKVETTLEGSAMRVETSSIVVEQFYTPRAWDLEEYDEVKFTYLKC